MTGPDLLAEVRRHWLPDAVVAWGEPTDSPLWDGPRAGLRLRLPRATRCQVPAADIGVLADQLAARGVGRPLGHLLDRAP